MPRGRKPREIEGQKKLIILDKILVEKADKIHPHLSSFFNEKLAKHLKNA